MAWGSALGEYLQPGDVGAALANHSARRILMDLDLGLRVCACTRANANQKAPALGKKNSAVHRRELVCCASVHARACEAKRD